MILYGGERVTLTSGCPSIESIGVSLGRIVRFCGHTYLPYTVLGHSLTVAGIMPEHLAIGGLLHDTQEIMFSDVPTPMKSQVARNRERTVQERIYIGLGVPWPASEEMTAAIEEADHVALVAEANVLQHAGCIAQWGTEYDAEAARLTRKYQKKTVEWFSDPDASVAAFAKAFKKYYALAGLDQPSW